LHVILHLTCDDKINGECNEQLHCYAFTQKKTLLTCYTQTLEGQWIMNSFPVITNFYTIQLEPTKEGHTHLHDNIKNALLDLVRILTLKKGFTD